MRESSEEHGPVRQVELRPAGMVDLPAVVSLLNRAYRGAGAEAGWNSEAGIIDGERTNQGLLRQQIESSPEGTLLVWKQEGELCGCVWLEPVGDGCWLLGSLAVEPKAQNNRFGRRLLAAAEKWVRLRGGHRIRMTVVNARDTLIAWYARRGFLPTGETEPFPYADGRFGVPRVPGLCFLVLAKEL